MPFDVVRRFSQPMGIDLDRWNGRVIDQQEGTVRLLPVAERAKTIFGEEGAGGATGSLEKDPGPDPQLALFPDWNTAPTVKRRRDAKAMLDSDVTPQAPGVTTLDRVHAAKLLQASGHANALRTLLPSEQERGPDFVRLANALSALYPRGSREKRLLDAMLLAAPR